MRAYSQDVTTLTDAGWFVPDMDEWEVANSHACVGLMRVDERAAEALKL